MREWLLRTYEVFEKERNPRGMDPSRLPGWNYSRALCVYLNEVDAKVPELACIV